MLRGMLEPVQQIETPPGTTVRQRPDLRAVAGLLVAIVLLFAPTLGFGLLHGWDDNLYVTNNAARLAFTPGNIAYWFTHDCVLCYLPLTMLSYMVDHALWGLNAFGYRLQNLVWHGAAALAFFALLRGLRLRPLPAFLAALLWAVHPQRVESVVWVSERKDVLCAAFYLAALVAYLRALGHGRRPWLALGLFVAAMLGKSMAISLPVALTAIELHRWVGTHGLRLPDRDGWRAVVWRLLPFVVVALLFVPVTVYFQSIPAEETTPARQLGVAVHNLLWYAVKTVLPGGLCPIYPRITFSGVRVAGLALSGVGLVALLAAAWRRWPATVVGVVLPGLVAYAAALGPVSGIVPLGHVDMSDRYGYIPSVFLWTLAAAGLQAASRGQGAVLGRLWRRLCLPALGLLAAGYAATSLLYSRLWQDIETLTRAACQREPANVFALGQLGDILLDVGGFDEALVIGGRLAAADHPWMTPAARRRALARGLYLQGFALFRLGQTEEALRAFETIAPHLETTVFHEPTNNTAIYAMMAEAYRQRGDQAGAGRCYDALLRRVPDTSFEWHFYKGVRSLCAGESAEAGVQFLAAERLRPGNPLVRQNLERLGLAPSDSSPPAPTH